MYLHVCIYFTSHAVITMMLPSYYFTLYVVASIAGGCDATADAGHGNVPSVPLQTCVGVVGCIMTIPCGNHTPSPNGTATYTLATAHSQLTRFTVDTFLTLNMTLSHHKGRIICSVGQQILGEYVLNVTRELGQHPLLYSIHVHNNLLGYNNWIRQHPL